MQDQSPTHEHIEHLREGLRAAANRAARWFAVCFLFGLLVLWVAYSARSIVFAVIAGFFWFFAWNRWRLWSFLCALAPVSVENEEQWFETARVALQYLPRWYKASEMLAAVTGLAIYIAVTVEVVMTSGFFMRCVWAGSWTLAIVIFAYRWLSSRRTQQ